ncbi:MAG: hypothetical protein GX081_09400 [Firmicutes bacterium]|nr:hypothetical protein [Bacillota bacterium]
MGTEEWIPAQVPGSVLNDLLMAGRLPDPYYRDQEARVKEFANYDYEYTREFEVDERVTGCTEVVLFCAGLDTLAEIRLNGMLVGKTAEDETGFIIIVKANAFAKAVYLEIEGVDGVFSDNFFDLPGKTEKVVRLEKSGLTTNLSLKDLREKLAVSSLFEHTR